MSETVTLGSGRTVVKGGVGEAIVHRLDEEVVPGGDLLARIHAQKHNRRLWKGWNKPTEPDPDAANWDEHDDMKMQIQNLLVGHRFLTTVLRASLAGNVFFHPDDGWVKTPEDMMHEKTMAKHYVYLMEAVAVDPKQAQELQSLRQEIEELRSRRDRLPNTSMRIHRVLEETIDQAMRDWTLLFYATPKENQDDHSESAD